MGNRTGRKPRQLPLALKTWGGRRKRAGRKPKGLRALVPHKPRAPLRPGWALHTTLRVHGHVWNLRSARSFRVLHRCFAAGKDRFGFRLVHYSIMGNHLHLVVEAPDNEALARGMQGLAIRIAKGLNRLMGRRGAVFADHYHSRVLRSPTEAARALAYVFGNFLRHASQWGEQLPPSFIDPYTSAAEGPSPPVAAPRTWLLRVGWRRGIARR